MFKNPSFLFDILCTAAWIVLTVRYARKGFLASMVQLLGNGLSLLGAHQLSSACAGWVFEHLLAGGFRTQIAASLAAGGVVDLTGIADKYAGFLPQSFRASIVAACERSIGAVLSDNAVVLDKNLGVQYSSGVPTANRIVRDGSTFYLLTDSTVECFSSRDGYQWSLPLDARPQALLASGKRLLVFSGNTVQALSAPDAAASGAQ